MLRRETIIALRARHTAFRVAVDMLYPPQLPPEEPPQLQLPVEPIVQWGAYDPARVARIRRRFEAAEDRRERRRALFIVFGGPLALFWFAYMVWTSEVDAPSPPASGALTVQVVPAPPPPPQGP